MREQAAAAAPMPPIPTAAELAAAEAEREAARKEKAAARSARYRDRRAERASKRELERRRRAIPWNLQGAFQANPVLHVQGDLDGAETREEWLIRSAREREEAAADPAKFVFRWSGVTANGSSLNYDHQDDDDCARVARRLIEWNDSMLPEGVLIDALRRNDPYRYPQPLDLDSYAVRYRRAGALTRAGVAGRRAGDPAYERSYMDRLPTLRQVLAMAPQVAEPVSEAPWSRSSA
jgi:hypothetical protein